MNAIAIVKERGAIIDLPVEKKSLYPKQTWPGDISNGTFRFWVPDGTGRLHKVSLQQSDERFEFVSTKKQPIKK